MKEVELFIKIRGIIMTNQELIKLYLAEEISTVRNLNIYDIEMIYNVLNNCLRHNKRVFIFGNGGSGSTASHMTNDFNKAIFAKMDNTFNFICLNDNIATILAVSNDIGFEEVFRYQLVGNLKKDDVVIAISGSGNSKNIINAVNYAKSIGTPVIGFTGYDGGLLKKKADFSLNTNVHNMQITEDIHLMFDHLLISMFYKNYGERKYKTKKLERNNKYE